MAPKFFSCDERVVLRFLACLFFGLLAVCPFTSDIHAQGVGAAIQGTVRDTTGAVVRFCARNQCRAFDKQDTQRAPSRPGFGVA